MKKEQHSHHLWSYWQLYRCLLIWSCVRFCSWVCGDVKNRKRF
jgi:hypothetical protein